MKSRSFEKISGDYLRKWLPELRAVREEGVHEPWKLPPEAQKLVDGYPAPCVDPEKFLLTAKPAKPKVRDSQEKRGQGLGVATCCTNRSHALQNAVILGMFTFSWEGLTLPVEGIGMHTRHFLLDAATNCSSLNDDQSHSLAIVKKYGLIYPKDML